MTRRRRLLLLFGLPPALVMLGVGGLGFVPWSVNLEPKPGVTPENAARIREGMTLAQVEAILAVPARDETRRRSFNSDWVRSWWSDSSSYSFRVYVRFSPAERVTGVLTNGRRPSADGPLTIIRHLLRL
jgi:hypothetical protein